MIYQLLNERIEKALEEAYDPETGELLIPEEELFGQIREIEADQDEKIDAIACEMKNLFAEAEGIKAEKLKLGERQSRLEKRAERLKRLLAWLLQGETWKNARHAISYRKSTELVIDDGFVEWAEAFAPGLLRITEEPRKDEIKRAIKEGKFFDLAHIIEKNNIQIK